MDAVDLWERVRFACERSGRSMRSLSEAIQRDPKYVQKLIERKATRPDIEALAALARELNVQETWLVYGRGSPDAAGVPDDRTPQPTPVAPSVASIDGSPLERALGEAFDHTRHSVSDLRAVQDALGKSLRLEHAEASLVESARIWLDAAAALRREGHPIDAVAILYRVTSDKTARPRPTAAEPTPRNDERGPGIAGKSAEHTTPPSLGESYPLDESGPSGIRTISPGAAPAVAKPTKRARG
jgi:transcriptional regulator with XRE-family HTH domain